MSAAAKVTIVVPVYNAEAYLAATLESALSQTFDDFELLLLDNASTDGTPEIAARFTDSRICSMRNPVNLGFAGNIALGIKSARGQYVAVLGADDIWHPEFLARTVQCLDEHPEAAVVHTGATWIDAAGRPFGETNAGWAPFTPPGDAFLLSFRHGFCFSAMLMRGVTLRGFGGVDVSWGPYADLYLFLALTVAGWAAYISEPLVQYRHHEDNISTRYYAGHDGGMFRGEVAYLKRALEWPESRALGLATRQRDAIEAIAERAVRTLHLARTGGAGTSWCAKYLASILPAAPRILLRPGTWARLAFASLPIPVIRTAQTWKRERFRRRRENTASSKGARGFSTELD